MALFTYDLHVHSCLSPCGDDDMTPCNIAGMAFLAGIKIVALTDHNSCKNCASFFTACEEYGITAVAGCELTTAEEIHMVCLFEALKQAIAFDEAIQPHRMRLKNRKDIFGSQPIMASRDEMIGEDPYFLPAATSLTIEQAVKMVSDMGGIAYPAHIDRESGGLLSILGSFPAEPAFGLCEVRDADKAPSLAGGREVVVSSDAHRLTDFGLEMHHILLNADEDAPPDEIRRALFTRLRAANQTSVI